MQHLASRSEHQASNLSGSTGKHSHTQASDEVSQSKKRNATTARSKVEEQARNMAGFLRNLIPVFDRVVMRLPEEIRQKNKIIFDNWNILLASVDSYASWPNSMKAQLKLRLQNAPNDIRMDSYNAVFEEFSKLVTQLQQDLPSPSDFAKPDVWPSAQGGSPILCLRPTDAKGLPLCTLHDVFRQFRCDTAIPLPDTTRTDEAVAARIAASKLCLVMGDSFEDGRMRGEAFDACVGNLFPVMEKDYVLKSNTTIHDGKVDRVFLEDDIVIVLREDKLEPGYGGGDVYMQIARDYDLLVKVLAERAETEPKAKSFIAHGTPCFLICVLGPLLIICGGFYDGNKPVVEPLCNPVFMLYDDTRTRQVEVATTLWALCRGISSLKQLLYQPSETTFAPSTPRIYKTCTLMEPQGETGTLTFQSKLSDTHQRLFLATLDSPSYSKVPVLVKLVPGSYSEEVHRFLAAHKQAPKLYGYAKVDGAPIAYIMEYLDPSNWTTLHQFVKSHPTALSDTRIQGALKDVLDMLKSKKCVHGDLRANNIMIRTNEEDSVEIRVIDFDWAGKANEARYPAERNPEIKGMKWPGKPGGLIEDDHDRQLMWSWVYPESSTAA